MPVVKKPVSLRADRSMHVVAARKTRHTEVKAASVITAACLAASVSTNAIAQSTSTGEATELPKLDVETTLAKPKPKKKTASPPTDSASSTPTDVTPTLVEGPVVGASGGGGPSTPGGNPYAEPGAPYKINQSASVKFTEPLVDTPKTVQTVPKEVLQDKQATSIRELARTTPGVTLGYGEGGAVFGDNLYIRGFKANNDAYIDGIRDPGTTSRETFMVEQVEILKGPSSSVGGRGTTGGAINVVTKKPQDKNFQHGGVTFGTDRTKRTTVDVNQVFDPTFQVRANGMWQDADVAGRDEVFDDRWGAAFAAKWTPTRYFSLTADYYHLDLDQMSDWGVPYNNDINAPWPEAGLDRSNFYGIPERDFQKGEQDIATLTAELELTEDTKLTSKLRRGRTKSRYVVTAPGGTDTSDPDPDNWTVGVSYKSNHQVTDVLANQTDLRTDFRTGFLRHSVVTGFELSREEVDKRGYEDLVSEDFGAGRASCDVNLFNPVPPGVGTGCWDGVSVPVPSDNPTLTEVITKSIYLLDTVKFSDAFLINGGVRIDNYDIARDGVGSTGPFVYERQDTMFNWNAGVVYKPAPNGSLYASVATSTNPMGQEIEAGGGSYGGLDENGELLDPEKNTAYEIGTKWELFDRKLLVTAALFQTTKENAREDVGPRGATVTDDTGEYRIRGIEIGAAGNITEDLSIYAGAVFMDSTVLESANEEDVGKKLANIAHQSFNILAKYRLTDSFTVGGQATYRGEIMLGSLAENGKALPSSWRFDLLAEWQATENIDVQLNVQNVFDEVIYDSGYRSGSPFVYVAPGRAAYLNVNFKY